MNLEIKWHKPLKLKDGSKIGLIYKIDGLEAWNGLSGVYMFCRQYAKSLAPLYIGKADDVGRRIKQHLNSIKLMKGIENSQNGDKILMLGTFVPKSGQNKQKAISSIEKALIEHALLEGYELLNKQGTKTPVHKISFSGYLPARNMTGQSMYIKAK